MTAAHAPEAEFPRLDLGCEHGRFVVLSAIGTFKTSVNPTPHAKMQNRCHDITIYILPTLPLAIIMGLQNEHLTHIYRGN